ncbi:FAD/NAD(P)-binding domain-containing protein [Penicillium nucicola]|uniref:FAD/NAD(P)-binding domain-containing protein n=1 Tax=Penicillium nucicola TaxID=1850975 RepID=UPI002544F65C|nr:FAD/NAD(P)-binding domain-containing protein [Penicillium nucicola]KAJ5748315.1 FAD/NAD(P)-binding domain-containing protein [Penicillium nucicola]
MEQHECRPDLDVIIVGAGLAGINAAYRVHSELQQSRYLVIEGKSSIGGTWNNFRYPGLRADSDVYTYSYPWFPWNQKTNHADRESILNYLTAAANSFQLEKHTLFDHKLHTAHWSTKLRQWRLVCRHDQRQATRTVTFRAKFVIFCTGIFSHDEARPVVIAGLSNFAGPVVHPQFWPEHLNYADKRILLIGSGATAMTLLPELADTAASVTLVQRSPGYLLTLPEREHSRNNGYRWTYQVKWITWIMVVKLFYQLCCLFPGLMKFICIAWTRWQLPVHVPVKPHFTPSYNPWEQRPIISFGRKIFRALESGRASIETGHIAYVDRHGVMLQSGKYLSGDIIVTATGLKLQFAGGTRIFLGNTQIEPGSRLAWNAVMVQDIPNAGFVTGYVHTSWTLGTDMRTLLICRVIRDMERDGIQALVPRCPRNMQAVARRSVLLTSSYILSQEQCLPKVGDVGPWRARNTYLTDFLFARYSRGVYEGLTNLDKK